MRVVYTLLALLLHLVYCGDGNAEVCAMFLLLLTVRVVALIVTSVICIIGILGHVTPLLAPELQAYALSGLLVVHAVIGAFFAEGSRILMERYYAKEYGSS